MGALLAAIDGRTVALESGDTEGMHVFADRKPGIFFYHPGIISESAGGEDHCLGSDFYCLAGLILSQNPYNPSFFFDQLLSGCF